VQHAIDVDALGPMGEPMADAISSCVHCGFCLPTCPTYVELGEEMDSPRGRIFLMKEVLEGKLEVELALPYVDNCLGCQACETSCPSGVPYGELITPFRMYAEERRTREPMGRLQRALMLATLPHPRRLRIAARAGRLAKPLQSVLPRPIRSMLDLLPPRLPPRTPLPALVPAQGERRARVALLAGCAQQVLAPDIGWATVRVLARNGVEIVVPNGQGCCGALALHTGARDPATRQARATLAAFPDDVDALVVNAAGCASGMKEYGLLLTGEPDEAAGRAFAERVVDVAAFLAQLGLRETPPPLAAPLKVAYHDACHLAHAQGVRAQPRELLAEIEGVELVEPAEWELCCGSAGTYNIEKPETAHALGERKVHNLLATGADLVASGNIGCLTQIETHLRLRGRELPILHTIQVLDRAYETTLEELRR
jgi:glycolate oxidase iron-sulfur subunit